MHRTDGHFVPLAGTLLLAASLLGPAARAQVRNTEPRLQHVEVNRFDQKALRTGALFFMYDCLSCHSVQGARFSELTGQLGLSAKQVQQYLNTTARRVGQTMKSSMSPKIAEQFMHKAPPDLTVIAKRRSVDWLYTYLKSFYLDPSRPTGVNNVVVQNVAMPDVLASLQGLQKPVMQPGWRFGVRQQVAVGVRPETAGSMSPAQFDRTVRDIVLFLDAMAHPHARARATLGPWIVGLFAALTALSYLLYRQYWRRVVTAGGPRWRTYRGRR